MDFTADRKLLGVLDSSHVFCVWDVDENLLVRFNDEYKAQYTCFIWLRNDPKLLNIGGDIAHFAALGKANGCVDLYSVEAGNVKHTLKDEENGHRKAVRSICLHNSSPCKIYTCGEDRRIVRWSLEHLQAMRCWNIGSSIPTCIFSLPDDRFMVVCGELCMWSLPKEGCDSECISLYMGAHPHSTAVNSMRVVERTDRTGVYVLTIADRQIHLWHIDGLESTHAIFSVEYAPTFVSCLVVENRLMVTVASPTDGNGSCGAVHLFILDEMRIEEVVDPSVTISLESYQSKSRLANASHAPTVAATLFFDSDNDPRILIAIGHTTGTAYKILMFRFEEIEYDPTVREQTHRLDEPEALEQALSNHDANLLHSVFFHSDVHAVNTNLRHLPSELLTTLVDVLIWLAEQDIANRPVVELWAKQLYRLYERYLNGFSDTFRPLLEMLAMTSGMISSNTESI